MATLSLVDQLSVKPSVLKPVTVASASIAGVLLSTLTNALLVLSIESTLDFDPPPVD